MDFLKKINLKKALNWTIAFLLIFVVFQIVFTFDFFNTYSENKRKAKLLYEVEKIEKAYFNVSPFWLKRYNIEISSSEDILLDQDNDGLNLKEEYKNLTNPFDSDTDKDGYPDGEEIKNGYNPLGNGRLDRNMNDIPDFWEEENGFSTEVDTSNEDPDGDKLVNGEEFLHGTDPNNNDTDGDEYDDFNELTHGYDPLVPGSTRLKYEIIIQKIGVTAPIVLSTSPIEADILEDLENGVILYPKTAIPGEDGNTVITGHSSNYSWVKGAYNYIFKNLNSLETEDIFEIKMTQSNGKTFSYKYQINQKEIVSADDRTIFQEKDEKQVTLITCWPLNTNLKRLMIKASLME